GSLDGTLRWWDFERRTSTELRGHTDCVDDVALAADGCFALSASADGTLRWWDLNRAASIELHLLKLYESGVLAGAFPDRGRALFCGALGPATATDSLESRGGPVALASDGRPVLDGRLAVKVAYGTLLWRDLERGTSTELRGHSTFVWAVALAPDGRYALSG